VHGEDPCVVVLYTGTKMIGNFAGCGGSELIHVIGCNCDFTKMAGEWNSVPVQLR
jgi:hypothetical protein